MDVTATAVQMVPGSPGEVFDWAVDPARMPDLFVGFGPIPGIRSVEIVGGGPPTQGAVRRVHNSDGSAIDEELVALERPHRQAYRLLRGFRPPVSLLVRSGSGEWRFSAAAGGTEVRWHFRFELRSPLLWPLAAVIMKTVFRWAMIRCLRRLGAQVGRRSHAGRSAAETKS